MKKISFKKTVTLAASSLVVLASAVGLAHPASAEDCVRTNPSVSFVSPSSQTAAAGQLRTYTMDVTNNDSASCLTSDFSFSAANLPAAPSIWNAVVTPNSPVTLAPGATVRVSMDVASDTDPDGTYVLTMRTTQHYNDAVPTADVVVDTNVTYVISTPTYPGDTTLPTVSIVSPQVGATLARNKTANIVAQASDDTGVTQMVYRTDNGATTICSGDASLTSCAWTPTKRGTYTLTVTAFDAAGNSRTASVLVYVR